MPLNKAAIGSEAASRRTVFLDNVSNDVADFGLHTVAMPRCPPLQPFLYVVFNVADKNLSHFEHLYAIMIASLPADYEDHLPRFFSPNGDVDVPENRRPSACN
jgi:hypothetical protein